MAQEGISFADIPFADRADAGRRLARVIEAHLTEKADFADPLVMALPRGGVPVAFEVARTLGASLELLIVRKIGAPGHPEFGLGALVDSDEPQVVLNAEAMRIADRLVCLASPTPFHAVSIYYDDFEQTTDAEVIALLRQARGGDTGFGQR
ncbi:hypothetical protein GOC60_19065 [Sinorhizobium meliloti]|nr:hypothetical protein [Sinorhizobium meliloti]MDX0263279.1 hypothetical protein [Sinorhizobium meliloti]MDX0350625.1 hypothetical protein [Sinorhizobium meliloti]